MHEYDKGIISLRRKKKLLRVIFPSEEPICYNNATTTFIEALKRIGVKRFPEIPLKIGHLPMITKEEYPKYKGYMKPIMDGWFVNTQSDTEQKFLQLRSINDLFDLGLIIEIGTNFEITGKPINKQKKSAKDNLLVQFPDGEFIAEENPVDTFLQSIWKIGIDEYGQKTSALRIFENCYNLIRCFPLAQYDDKNPNDVAKEPHEITHALDAIRYFCAGRPMPAILNKEGKKQLPFALRTDDEQEEDYIVW